MKATLEFQLPEEKDDHAYALAGVDALLTIDDLLNEIRNKLHYESGPFKSWKDWEGKEQQGHDATLEKVREVLLELKQDRRLPELV
jgi:hypothetical protein